MSILIFLVISYLLLSAALYVVFPKCGKPAVNGLIPVVNFMDWCDIIGRPRWWAFLLFIPIVNIFIFVGMAIDLGRSFGKLDFKHTAAATIYAPAFLGYLGLSKDESYVGPVLATEKEYINKMEEAKNAGKERTFKKLEQSNPYKKSGIREWFESVFFAVFAAAFIRMFLIEAYVIPTPSMEGSLNVGDFLFVSKSSYGIRTPMTVAMIPLLHNRIPKMDAESYLEKPSLPYYRLPALRQIKHNSPFVFNWPVGDSVYVTPSRPYSVAQVRREPQFAINDRALAQKVKNQDFITRPIDKKDHYIKRCVALPGDSLQIKDGQIFINGTPSKNPKHLQFQYMVSTPATNINMKRLEEWGIDAGDSWGRGTTSGYFLDERQVQQLQGLGDNVQIVRVPQPAAGDKLFPHDPKNYPGWTVDNYGPIYIPAEGATVELSLNNLAMYRRVISVYEGNTVNISNGQIMINGQPATSYTFKQNYYWAMGDNRHNSEDSRMWGYVPHDHIVGRPLFIWFSTKEGNIRNGINWDRIFMSATKD
mgnify:CR=1 FL=1